MMANDVTNKYKDMIESFECDFDLALNESFGLTYMNQMLKRIKNKEKLMKKDLIFLKDFELLQELSFKIRHNEIIIIEKVGE